MSDLVLVTGITGYIASHVAAKLIERGYRVRGTVRNKAKGRRVLDAMAVSGVDVSGVELVEADLGSDAGWRDAVEDCRFVQHLASPFPFEAPSDREALVPEARAGTQRVLENGFSAGAERIVMTSSVAAMMYQPGRGRERTYGEDDWSDPDWKALTAYPVSKTRAELSAWAYAEAQGLRDRLVTVNPGLVLGPDPYDNGGASLSAIRDMMNGDFPAVPKLAFPVVDVRDCAAIHVAAMDATGAAGRRLIAAGETLSFARIGEILETEYPTAKLPKFEAPSLLLRALSLVDDRIKTILPDLGHTPRVDAAYVTSLTGVVPRPARESVLASARDLVENGNVVLGA
ncbi:MAG: NAD-dependent epimerase/dehydratase family protein [Pseudomonadota bacterium]